jgi:gliding motility-associated-like protein
VRFYLAILICFLLSWSAHAQLQSCVGAKGAVVFYENFGDGVGIAPAFMMNETSYTYTQIFPETGEYTIRSNTLPNLETLPDINEWQWHLLANDLTDILTSVSGKMMLINANHEDGIFYQKRIGNLCGEVSYEFSFWVAPLYNISSEICPENGGLGVPVNIKIEVWNTDESQLLTTATTGNINNTATINYQRYSVLFTTPLDETDVVIKILNNNDQAGCGNDLVIDEITVQVCGSNATVSSLEFGEDVATFCDNETPVTLTLFLENDGEEAYFTWQRSTNGYSWENINEIPILHTGGNLTTTLEDIATTSYFRVAFALNENNLQTVNPNCNWFSNTYSIEIISSTTAPQSFFDEISYCGDSEIPALAVMPANNLNVNWYDSPTGGNLLLANSLNYVPTSPGTYYAGFSSDLYTCIGSVRTAITLNWYPGIMVSTNPDPILICGNDGVILDAIHPNSIYEWEPSSLGNGITAVVYEPGLYTVTIRDPNSPCTEARTRNFIVYGYVNPQIANISHSGTSLTVTMDNTEVTYEFSLDGINWQNSNVFNDVENGLVTVYVRDLINCGTDYQEYFILNAPTFITPNGDGYNDYFTIKDIDLFDLEVYIFDRYGKLITLLNANNPNWDGRYNNKELPSTDYWYEIYRENTKIRTGHFSIKR